MGSTITSGRAAAAVRTHDGQSLFLLFEETCCSNVLPRAPSWCCMGIGYLPAVMKLIFEFGSVCEGGMLRGRSGRLTPEGYIASWLEQLAHPLLMTKTTLRFGVGSGYGATIDYQRLEQAVDVLNQAGLPIQAAKFLHTHSTSLDLVNDADGLITLQQGLSLEPWRLIDAHVVAHRSGTRDPRAGYKPATSKQPPLDEPVALSLNDNVRLLRDESGAWRCRGWQYALVGSYVRDLWKGELEYPGHHRKRISTFRSALFRAEKAPQGMVVEINTLGVDDPYTEQKFAELQRRYGSGQAIFRVPVTFETEYALGSLPSSCAEWIMPDGFHCQALEQAALAF